MQKRTKRSDTKKTAYFLGSCVPINTYNCGLWIGLNDQEEEGQFKWENSNLPVTFDSQNKYFTQLFFTIFFT